MKSITYVLFVSVLILGISARKDFLNKLNKEINAKQIKFLAQNTNYGPLFPNTNTVSPHYYPDSTADKDATSCDNISWKPNPESDLECGTQTETVDSITTTTHKYCETIEKPFCFKTDADIVGFGQCGTNSEVPYFTDLLVKAYSRFTLPKHCFCGGQVHQED